jgi:hypothetical protein
LLTAEQMTRPRIGGDVPAGLRGTGPAQAARQAGEQLSDPSAWTAETRLILLRAEYARLITAARASVAAARAGSSDPLVYVEAELVRHCGLPPRDATVPAVLADARAAMALAGRVDRPHEPGEISPVIWEALS